MPKSAEELFAAALGITTPAERAALLDRECAGNPALRAEVESLLAAHVQASKFLENPPAATTGIVPLTEKPGDKIGRYKLLQKIGEGGCGVVYMAEQEEPIRRRVALKVIKLGMDTRQVIARFEAERQALALMDHPNIAKVHDGGATETGRPYFVMELVRGIKITDYCDQNNLSTRERLDLFIEVCQAIQHAHQKGIIHRDIKPSNILVTLHDGVPVPKVIDFGIAKATEGRLTDKSIFTEFQQFIGTPAYMSPEQAELSGLDIDTRTDIYALGVLLYELLTGTTPFDAKQLLDAGLDEMRRIIREEEPARPSARLTTLTNEELTAVAKHRQSEPIKLTSFVRGDLDWIVMKCLEKDRTRRYETANGLAMDLLRHLRHEPVVAAPPSSAYRLQRFARRHRVALATASAFVLAVLGGIVTSTWQAWRANRFAREANTQRQTATNEAARATSALKESEQLRQRAETGETEARRLLYAANLNLIQREWNQNQLGRLRELLEETRNFPERDFEWYYWQRQIHRDLSTLRGHLGPVRSVAFSPDGKKILTGGYTVKVWEAETGRELLTLNGHNVGSAAFFPDGRRIVFAGEDQTARVSDAVTGRELLTLNGHSVGAVAISPNGERILTGSADNTARVWEAATGREVLTLKGHTNGVYSVAFSPDGQRVLTGSSDQTAKLWNAATGRELLTLVGDAGDLAVSVAFSPNGQRILTGGGGRTAKVWEASTGRELLTLDGHNAGITSVTSEWGTTPTPWPTLNGHSAGITSVAFSPDGQRIVTGSLDHTANLWDATTGRELLTLKGHSGWVSSVAFSPEGGRVVTGSLDGAKVWDAGADLEALSLRGHSASIKAVTISVDGQKIVTGSRDRTAKVWDAASGRDLFTFRGHTGSVESVAFSSDSQRIASSSPEDATTRVWEASTGRELLTLSGGADCVIFSPDSRRIVTCSSERLVLWDAATGADLLRRKIGDRPVASAAFSPDGERIILGGWDFLARIWDVARGQELFTLKGHTAPINSVAFFPDGQRVLTGSFDRTAKVWDATSGRELFSLKGHAGEVLSVAVSPSGRRIATGSLDQTIKLWDAVSGRELLTLNGHTGQVWSVAFSSDGRRLVSGSEDHTAKIWEVATPEQVHAWTDN